MKNALSFDLEAWYHPEAIRTSDLTFERVSHVFEATTPLLDLLARYHTQATFFTVGEVAHDYPQLIDRILNEGHELAFHGWTHNPLWAMTPQSFADEIERFLELIQQKFRGVEILGFRAPTFSLDNSTAWAIQILNQYDFIYDSSVFPAKTPLYGVPAAPLYAYHMHLTSPAEVSPDENYLLEIPMSVYPILNQRIGFTGGLYLRALPLSIIKKFIKRTNAAGRPVVMYIHPWETYADTPRLPLSRWQSFILYHGLPSFNKLEKLLQSTEFEFDTMQSVYLSSGN